MKRTTTNILLSIFAAIISWSILGALLGFAGMALTSFIPFFGLGVFLAALGALLHVVFIIFNVRPASWKVGLGLSIVLSSFSIISGTLAGDRFPITFMLFFISYYFVFGALLYSLIQVCVVELFS